MDREALTKKMKALKAKAKAARKEGKKELSNAFRNGATRLQRVVASLLRAEARVKKPAE